jgi:hypothetical protein
MAKKREPAKKNDLIFESLLERGQTKKEVMKNTEAVFKEIRSLLRKVHEVLEKKLKEANINLDLGFSDKAKHEVEIRLNDDILIFSLHSNVFTFDHDHTVWQGNYVLDDHMRAHCGVIMIYNFLSDSFKYNRTLDTGYLIGRIFVNRENHIYVEGKRQLGFLYNDFENSVSSEKLLNDIIESALLFTVNFEILVPPYDMVKELTVQQKIDQTGSISFQTGKRLGFRFSADQDEMM